MLPEPYYQDDHATIYQGDCLQILADIDADVMITDPPYGISYIGGGPRTGGGKDVKISTKGETKKVMNDQTTGERDAVLEIWVGPAAVFGVWRVERPKSTRQRLLWIKNNTIPCLGATPWTAADEEIYVIGDGWGTKPKDLNFMITNEARAGIGGLSAMVGHPTPKPLDLMRWLISLAPEGIVVDPFMGSGSTLKAAKDLGRKSIGIELEERYCEVAATRLSQEVLDLGV